MSTLILLRVGKSLRGGVEIPKAIHVKGNTYSRTRAVCCYVKTMTNLSTIEQQTNISHIILLSIFMIMDPTCQKCDAMLVEQEDVMLGNEYKDYEILDYIN